MKTIKIISALVLTLFATGFAFGQFQGGFQNPGNQNLTVKPPQPNANVCNQEIANSAGHLLNFTKRQDVYKGFSASLNVVEFTMTFHNAGRNGKNYTSVTSGFLNDNNGGILTSKEANWGNVDQINKSNWQELRREEHTWHDNVLSSNKKVSSQQVELEINGLGCVSVWYSYMHTPKMLEQATVLSIGGVTYIMGYIFNLGDPTMVTIALRTDKMDIAF